jgi:hypothetical protein
VEGRAVSVAVAATGAGLLAGWSALGLAAERRALAAAESIPVRILVGGGRGKSTLARLVHRGLRAAGLRAVGRLTGDDPLMLLPDGGTELLPRRGAPNIREMRRDILRAASLGAQAAVFENMAVRPELQAVVAARLFPPTIALFAPDARDHLDVLPEDPVERAALALASVPASARVAHCATDEPTASAAARHDALAFPPSPAPRLRRHVAVLAGAAIGAVREAIGRDDPAVEQAILDEAASLQAIRATIIGGAAWIDLLSVNDPESTLAQVAALRPIAASQGFREARLVYFHRRDRAPRLVDFSAILARWGSAAIAGDTAPRAALGLGALPCLGASPARVAAFAKPGDALFCVGNSGGFGREFRAWLASSGEARRW